LAKLHELPWTNLHELPSTKLHELTVSVALDHGNYSK